MKRAWRSVAEAAGEWGASLVLAPTENVSSFADIDAGNRAQSCDGAHVQVGAAKSNTASLARRPSPGLLDRAPSRAVNRNRNGGRPALLNVHPDRFEHVAEPIGTFRLARYRVGHCGPDELGMITVR